VNEELESKNVCLWDGRRKHRR